MSVAVDAEVLGTTRVCDCGENFIVLRHDQRACSSTCSRRAKKVQPDRRACVGCGGTFESAHNRRAYCSKACTQRAARSRKKDDPDYRLKARYAQVLRDYGLTSEQYDALLSECQSRCPGCETSFAEVTPAVDHDHETGEVRGLLCRPCNLSVGNAQDSPHVLVALAAYLMARETPVSAKERI